MTQKCNELQALLLCVQDVAQALVGADAYIETCLEHMDETTDDFEDTMNTLLTMIQDLQAELSTTEVAIEDAIDEEEA